MQPDATPALTAAAFQLVALPDCREGLAIEILYAFKPPPICLQRFNRR
jgi:hypothetical protein